MRIVKVLCDSRAYYQRECRCVQGLDVSSDDQDRGRRGAGFRMDGWLGQRVRGDDRIRQKLTVGSVGSFLVEMLIKLIADCKIGDNLLISCKKIALLRLIA